MSEFDVISELENKGYAIKNIRTTYSVPKILGEELIAKKYRGPVSELEIEIKDLKNFPELSGLGKGLHALDLKITVPSLFMQLEKGGMHYTIKLFSNNLVAGLVDTSHANESYAQIMSVFKKMDWHTATIESLDDAFPTFD